MLGSGTNRPRKQEGPSNDSLAILCISFSLNRSGSDGGSGTRVTEGLILMCLEISSLIETVYLRPDWVE